MKNGERGDRWVKKEYEKRKWWGRGKRRRKRGRIRRTERGNERGRKRTPIEDKEKRKKIDEN